MSVFPSIREFIEALDHDGELVRISETVSANLQISALSDLVMKSPGGGKALLFENVEGFDIPVLVNAYGSEKRMAMALGVKDLEEIPRRIAALLKLPAPKGFGDVVKLLPKLFELRGVPPRKRRGLAPCQEIVLKGDAVDLGKFPVLTCWPDDGGPFITFPCVITKDPETGRQNIGMYRLQVFDRNTTGMHWHVHKDGSHSYIKNCKAGRRTEVAVAIGADPVVTYCATAPLPRGVDELMLAGFIRKKAVELVKCKTVDLMVPANAEIVLEGYVEPGETRLEGPFGDHNGVYSNPDQYPVFHVTAITHRKNPIYFTTIVGIPPMEDLWLGWATERIMLPLLNTQFPEIASMHLPAEGVFHNLCLIGMEKEFPMQGRRLLSGLWGMGQMSFTKTIAVVDPDVDVRNPREAALAILNNIRIPEDIVISQGVLDALDRASPKRGWGGKLGIDAATPMPGEDKFGVELPPLHRPLDEAELLASLGGRFPNLKKCFIPLPEARLTAALLVFDKKRAGEGIDLALAAIEIPGIDIAAAVDGTGDETLSFLVWRVFSSFDPQRDIRIKNGKAAIDASSKESENGYDEPWPKEVAHTPDMVAFAEKLAQKLGFAH